MDTLVQDLRFGLRGLRRRPLHSTLAVVTLALGLAASTAMFSVLDAVLWRPLPFEAPDEIVRLYTTSPEFEGHPTLGDVWDRNVFSWPEFVDVRDHHGGLLAGVSILAGGGAILTSPDGPAEVVSLGRVSADLFTSVLPVAPILGRTFTAEEERVGARVLVLGEGLWRRNYGADPGIVGSTITLGSDDYEVVGVLPAAFEVPFLDARGWIPMVPEDNRGNHSYPVLARLSPGVGPDRAMVELTRIAQDVAPDDHDHHGINVFRAHDELTRGVRGALTLLAVAAAVLLVVACGNVAVLLVGAAIDREQELAVRGALGAGRRRLVQQLLTEGMVLAFAGAAVGLALTHLATTGLVLMAPPGVPRIDEAGVDLRAAGFATLLTVACGLAFSLVPALLFSRGELFAGMGGSARGIGGGVRARLQGWVVVGELALATVLVVGAGLLGRTVLALDRVDVGFDADRLAATSFAFSPSRVVALTGDDDTDLALLAGFYDQLAASVEALPGVEGVAWTSVRPLARERGNNAVIPEGWAGEEIVAERRFVSADFFHVTGTPIVEGRGFQPDDDRADAPARMVISEGLARVLFPDGSAVGRPLRYWDRWATVVGVAGNVRDEGLREGTDFAFYVPRVQAGQLGSSMLVRTSGDPAAHLAAIRDRLQAVHPGLAVQDVRTLRHHRSDQVAAQVYRARLVAVFAGLATLFALMGIYGVTSRAVSARTRELGIRMALGAERGRVMGMVVRQALRTGFYGALAGLGAAWFATRFVEGYLWGVEPTDPLTLAGTALLLGAASVGAALAPGRRAARIDPMVALREE